MEQQATRPRTHSDYTVGWLCALPKEQTAAIAMLDQRHPELPRPPNDQNAYTLGSIGGHHIVIACLPKGKIGTNSAATVATRITQTFPFIKVGLMVGIGGGIPPEVRLGDVVIGTPTAEYPGVVQWDLGKAEDGGNFIRTGSLNNPPSFLLTALTKMESEVSMCGSKIQQYLDEALEKFPRLAPKCRRPASPQNAGPKGNDSQKPRGECEVHYGLIASGNKVIKDATVRDKINSDLGGNVLCIEMEAAGLLDYPSIVVRGICDYADSQKNKDWQEHASAVAAACAKEFLGYLQPSDIGNQCPISETLGQVLEKVTSLNVKARTDEEEKILTWITPFNYGEQHTDILKRQQPGTCQWVLNSDQYRDWMDTPKGILLCPGIPGAGKTIVTSVVVNDLIQNLGQQCDTGIAYIYCSHQQKNQQTIEDLIASLLKQLATPQAALPSAVTELYRRHKYKGTRPLLEEYLSALHSVSALYTKIFIIVDALDEFQDDDGRRREFLRELFNLRDKCGAHVFATSRFMPDIVDQFRGCSTLEIRANTNDIKKYLEENMTDLSIAMSPGCQLWDDIINEITDAASGMFLLAKLYLGSVSEKVSPNDIKETLKGFQRQGRESTVKSTGKILDSAYEQTMNRISEQSREFRKLAFNVLSWITCAKRRLNTWELRHALATRSGQSRLDPGDFIQLRLILRVCAGLVIVDEDSDIIRLAHRTTEVYFDRRKADLFPQCEARITRACIAYLSFSTFEDGYCQTPTELERRLDSYKFYEYASHNWGHHAREAKRFSTHIRNFLNHKMKVKAASQALMISN
ncbi:nucleoside phosphorylase, partial [Ilyonectria sp. MPI-CAGE-AT-0026]